MIRRWFSSRLASGRCHSRVPSFKTGFLLESPQDPSTYLDTPESRESPSFFEWPQLQQLLEEDETMKMVCFDQGATGHCRRKPTGLLTNLPMMEQLEFCKGGGATDPICGDLSQRMATSRSWSEWSSGLVRAIQYSLKEMLKEENDAVQVAKLDLDEWRRHVRTQHVPFRRDCRAGIEAMGTQHPHRRSKTASAAFTLAIDIIGPFTSGKRPCNWKNGPICTVGNRAHSSSRSTPTSTRGGDPG